MCCPLSVQCPIYNHISEAFQLIAYEASWDSVCRLWLKRKHNATFPCEILDTDSYCIRGAPVVRGTLILWSGFTIFPEDDVLLCISGGTSVSVVFLLSFCVIFATQVRCLGALWQRVGVYGAYHFQKACTKDFTHIELAAVARIRAIRSFSWHLRFPLLKYSIIKSALRICLNWRHFAIIKLIFKF